MTNKSNWVSLMHSMLNAKPKKCNLSCEWGRRFFEQEIVLMTSFKLWTLGIVEKKYKFLFENKWLKWQISWHNELPEKWMFPGSSWVSIYQILSRLSLFTMIGQSKGVVHLIRYSQRCKMPIAIVRMNK